MDNRKSKAQAPDWGALVKLGAMVAGVLVIVVAMVAVGMHFGRATRAESVPETLSVPVTLADIQAVPSLGWLEPLADATAAGTDFEWLRPLTDIVSEEDIEKYPSLAWLRPDLLKAGSEWTAADGARSAIGASNDVAEPEFVVADPREPELMLYRLDGLQPLEAEKGYIALEPGVDYLMKLDLGRLRKSAEHYPSGQVMVTHSARIGADGTGGLVMTIADLPERELFYARLTFRADQEVYLTCCPPTDDPEDTPFYGEDCVLTIRLFASETAPEVGTEASVAAENEHGEFKITFEDTQSRVRND